MKGQGQRSWGVSAWEILTGHGKLESFRAAEIIMGVVGERYRGNKERQHNTHKPS